MMADSQHLALELKHTADEGPVCIVVGHVPHQALCPSAKPVEP